MILRYDLFSKSKLWEVVTLPARFWRFFINELWEVVTLPARFWRCFHKRVIKGDLTSMMLSNHTRNTCPNRTYLSPHTHARHHCAREWRKRKLLSLQRICSPHRLAPSPKRTISRLHRARRLPVRSRRTFAPRATRGTRPSRPTPRRTRRRLPPRSPSPTQGQATSPVVH